jgi:hypothetical protein
VKSLVLIILLLLALFSTVHAEPFIAPEGAVVVSEGPRIFVGQPTYYFGMKGPNQQLKHTFHFRNEGVEDLIIHKVSPP